MTHEPESGIEPLVADWFRERHGERRVETQAYQPGPRWYCDIVVQLDWATLFVEIENDADSVRDGVAQAIGYAGSDRIGGVPMVVTPVGHLDDARADRLRRNSSVLIREFDGEEGRFVR